MYINNNMPYTYTHIRYVADPRFSKLCSQSTLLSFFPTSLKGKVVTRGYIIMYYTGFYVFRYGTIELHRMYKVPFIQITLYL